jgi:hypothetical protein
VPPREHGDAVHQPLSGLPHRVPLPVPIGSRPPQAARACRAPRSGAYGTARACSSSRLRILALAEPSSPPPGPHLEHPAAKEGCWSADQGRRTLTLMTRDHRNSASAPNTMPPLARRTPPLACRPASPNLPPGAPEPGRAV